MGKQNKDWVIVRPPLAPRFQLPTKEELFKVVSGDDVKLIFKAGDDIERMWVRVEQCGDMDEWTGYLDNDPFQEHISSVLKCDDFVKFHPYDVIGIEDNDDTQSSVDVEQIIDEKLHTIKNDIVRPWYRNPQIVVPAVIGIIGAITTLIAALI